MKRDQCFFTDFGGTVQVPSSSKIESKLRLWTSQNFKLVSLVKTGACAAASFKLHWFLRGIKEPIPAATSAALFPATWIFEPHSTALVSCWHEVDSLWSEKNCFSPKKRPNRRCTFMHGYSTHVCVMSTFSRNEFHPVSLHATALISKKQRGW